MWTLLVNEQAGGSEQETVARVASALAAHRPVRRASTSTVAALEAVLRDLPDDSTVAVVGGDGSLHAVVNALSRIGRLDDIAVVLVPMGTGNDFARTLGLDIDDPVAAAAAFADPVERRCDLIGAGDGQVVVNVVHVGVGAEAAKAGQPWKKLLGPIGYAVGSLLAGIRAPGFMADVVVDGQRVVSGRRLLQVAVGNGAHVGGGTALVPDADPFDGQADVIVSWAVPPWRRLGYTLRLRSGDHPDQDDTTRWSGTVVEVEGEPTAAVADGELTEPGRRHRWELRPAALRLVLPRS